MACSKPSALLQHAATLRDAAKMRIVSASPFEMYVVSMETVLHMTTLRVHEDLMADGLLHIFREGNKRYAAIFVSHQWAGNGHPDPDFEQFQVLQSFLSKLISRQITSISGNILAELYLDKPKIPAKELQSFELSIWYDWFSVPQAKEAVAARTLAIQSIPRYVETCHYFVMLCPLVKHQQEGTIMGKRSYISRGWCRLELAARILSERESSQATIEVHTSNHQVCSPIGDWILKAVGEGSFSVSQDLHHCAAVVTSMIDRKLEHFLKKDDLHSFRVLLNLRSVIYRSLPAVPSATVVPGFQSSETDPAKHSLELFLHQNGLTSVCDPCPNGWTPLCYAVLGGSPLLVSALLEARANPHDCLKKTQATLLPNIAGITVLQACIYLRHNEAAKVLISFKANVNAKDSNGAEAIHWASSSNNVDAIGLLCSLGSSPIKAVSTGHLPFAIASATDSLETLRELLPRTTRESVRSGLHSVFFFGGTSGKIVATLINAGADVNVPMCTSCFSTLGLILRFFALRHRWSKTALSTFAYHHQGATPLMCSLLTCSFEAAAVLLLADAKKEPKNARGKTASDFAEKMCAPTYIHKALQGDLSECEFLDNVEVMSERPLEYQEGWIHLPSTSLQIAEHQLGDRLAGRVDVPDHPVMNLVRKLPPWAGHPLPDWMPASVCELHTGKVGGIVRGRICS
ncbi:unnamed protein product [Symbiodinium necroappetens]|uniref:Uncharacterized protein n=1 Tax=Symbiodinium necroappetens TaxID=1628268 RepID=A0A812URJ9_9DINO|nr:unnamed protein product [Symbiodinium necroappetens]